MNFSFLRLPRLRNGVLIAFTLLGGAACGLSSMDEGGASFVQEMEHVSEKILEQVKSEWDLAELRGNVEVKVLDPPSEQNFSKDLPLEEGATFLIDFNLSPSGSYRIETTHGKKLVAVLTSDGQSIRVNNSFVCKDDATIESKCTPYLWPRTVVFACLFPLSQGRQMRPEHIRPMMSYNGANWIVDNDAKSSRDQFQSAIDWDRFECVEFGRLPDSFLSYRYWLNDDAEPTVRRVQLVADYGVRLDYALSDPKRLADGMYYFGKVESYSTETGVLVSILKDVQLVPSGDN